VIYNLLDSSIRPQVLNAETLLFFSVDVTHGHDYVAHVRFPPVPILWLLHILFVIAWA
jgi:hypothetical protein